MRKKEMNTDTELTQTPGSESQSWASPVVVPAQPTSH